jgi:hypothetical protein
VSKSMNCFTIDFDSRRFLADLRLSSTMKVDNALRKTIYMMTNLLPPPSSHGLRHLVLHSSPNFPSLNGLILRCPIRLPISVPASLAALHLSSQVLTRVRDARTPLRGVPPHDPCQYHVTFQAASKFLAQSLLLTLTHRGAAVPAALEKHLPPSGAIRSLPPDPAPTLLSSLRRLRVRHHAAHFSMLSNLSPPFLRARLSRKSSTLTPLSRAACLKSIAVHHQKHQRQRVSRPHRRSLRAHLKLHPGYLPPPRPRVPVAHPEIIRRQRRPETKQ